MGLFSKIRTAVAGYSNELVDKAIESKPLPYLKQHVRELEAAMGDINHQAAVAAATITTLGNQKAAALKSIENEQATAKAYLSKGDQTSARQVAGRIHDLQQRVVTLDEQIKIATENSKALDQAREAIKTKHDQTMSRVRDLEMKDRSSRALESASKHLQQAGEVLSSASVAASTIDDVASKVDARSDLAREEFNRTMADFQPASDPVRDQAVDSILESLKETPVVS